jgi:hypothetical protein
VYRCRDGGFDASGAGIAGVQPIACGGELKGGTISQPLQEAALLAACSWPYRVAASLLKRRSFAEISAEEIRLLTNRGGKQRALQKQEEAEQAYSSLAKAAPKAETTEAAQLPSAPHPEHPMLVGVDRSWVCSYEQRGGMEGKVAVVCSQVEDLPMPTYGPPLLIGAGMHHAILRDNVIA